MKIPSLLSNAAAVLALLLSVSFLFVSRENQALQSKLQKRQTEIQTQQQEIQLQQQELQAKQQQINAAAQLSKETGPAILRDLAGLQLQNKNEKIRKLLNKFGVQATESPAATPSPTSN